MARLFYRFFLRLVVPVALVVFIAALLGNLVQVGFLFTVKPITPDFNRIVPRFGRFFKKALFSREAFFNLAKSLFKILVIATISFLNIRNELPQITNFLTAPFLVSFGFIASLVFRIIIEATVAMLFLSVSFFIFLLARKSSRTSS